MKLGIINSIKDKIKVLGNGDIKKKLEVHADKFSASASKKIQEAGGKVFIIK